MALGDYQKTTYVNGTTPPISAENLNKNENKTAELDQGLHDHLIDEVKQIIIEKNVSILSANWVDDTATSGLWYYEVSHTDVTPDSVVDVNIHLTDLENASDIKPVTQSFTGKYRLYADGKPSVDITVDVRITNTMTGGGE